jgi:uncharacterized protein (DUF58 family)
VCLLLAIMIIGMMAIIFSNNLFYLITATLLAFVTISGIMAEGTLSGLRATRRMPEEVFAATPIPVSITLHNEKGRFPSFGLFLRESMDGAFGTDRAFIPLVPARSEARATYLLELPRRGRQRLQGLWIGTVFPFGLWEKTTLVPCLQEVLVFPCAIKPAFDLGHAPRDVGYAQTTSRGEGDGLISLREYQPGDPSRLIHWKGSARQGSLMVKELEQDAETAMVLVLAPVFPTTVETAVSMATGILLSLAERGISTTLLTWKHQAPRGTGRAHLRRQLEVLAEYCNAPDETWKPSLEPGLLEGTTQLLLHEEGSLPSSLASFSARALILPPESTEGKGR